MERHGTLQKRLLALAMGVCVSAATMAQAAPAAKATEPATPVAKAPTSTTAAKELDTGESLVYLGKKLWFEMRRRLNLTTEAEVQAQKQTEAQVKLKVGGVKVNTGE